MPVLQVSGPDLLKAVQQLEPDEFDAFLEQALSLRTRTKPATLSATETRLITRINRGLPNEVSTLYSRLVQKRKRRILTADEQAELLKLTEQVETRDAERAEDLLELAKYRQVPIRVLMREMGIKAVAVHG